MKKILLLNSFVILTNFVLGQSNTCGTNAVSNCSNPLDCYIDYSVNHTTSYWDWRGPSSDPLYLPPSVPSTLYRYSYLPNNGSYDFNPFNLFSPFEATNPSKQQLEFLTNTPLDYQPSDGWELVYQDFGYFKNANGSIGPEFTEKVLRPTFILYNRFSGMLRVFIATKSQPVSTSGYIDVAWSRTDGKKTALLNKIQHSPEPVKSFSSGLSQLHFINSSNLNCGNDDCPQWFYADLPTEYDPCTCGFSQKLGVDLFVKDLGKIEFKTIGTIVQENVVSSNNMVADNPFSTAFEQLQGLIGVGRDAQKAYESGDKFRKDAQGFINKNKSFFSENLFMSSSTIAKVSGLFGYVPYVSAALSAAQGLYNLFDPNSNSGGPTVNIVTSKVELTSSGTISNSYSSDRYVIAVPGSLNSQSEPFVSRPVYNNVLGVASLLETPSFEYVDYTNDQDHLKMKAFAFGAETSNSYYRRFKVREYKMSSPLKLLINPAAGVTLESGYAQFIIKPSPIGSYEDNSYANYSYHQGKCMFWGPYHKSFNLDFEHPEDLSSMMTSRYFSDQICGPLVDLFSFEDRSNLESAEYCTPLIGLDCIENQTFAVFKQIGISDPDPKVKVRFVLKFYKTGDPEKKPFPYIMTYSLPLTGMTKSQLDQGQLRFYTENPKMYEIENTPVSHKNVYTLNVVDIDHSPFQGSAISLPTEEYVGSWSNPNTSGLGASKKLYFEPGSITLNSDEVIYFSAGESITILPGEAGDPMTEISPNVELIIKHPPCERPVWASNSDVSLACNSGVYKDLSGQSKVVASWDNNILPPVSSATTLSYPIPNPASGQSTLSVTLAESSGWSLVLYNALGEKVKDVAAKDMATAGTYNLTIETADLEAGVYYLTFTSEGFRQARKLVVVK